MLSDSHKATALALGLAVAMFAATSAGAAEVCSGRFPVLNVEPKGHVPYCTSRPLHLDDGRVERLLLVLPSSNFDARMAFANGLAAISGAAPEVAERTVVVAPQFLERHHLPHATDPSLIYWEVNPFWGSSKALTERGTKKLRLSAYKILDTLLRYLTQPGRYPALRDIIVAGHSAGGQMAHRYSLSSRFEPPTGRPIELRFVVMNPSSYVYLDGDRPVRLEPTKFAPPSPEILAQCPAYDRYGYGLQQLYGYHHDAGLTAETMRESFSRRRVTYLVGSEDTARGPGLSTTCAAELQGRNRPERAHAYYRHLRRHFGPSISERQALEVVPGSGHSGKEMMTSPAGIRALFHRGH